MSAVMKSNHPAYDSSEALLRAMSDRRLTRSGVAILAEIIQRADVFGTASVSMAEMARTTGYTYRMIQLAVASLEENGYLRRTATGGGNVPLSVFDLTTPDAGA